MGPKHQAVPPLGKPSPPGPPGRSAANGLSPAGRWRRLPQAAMGNACPHRQTTAVTVPRVSPQEVQENGWVVIYGKVYNVHEYMAKHPGGRDLLLGVGGRDATVEFETMRHSDFAFAQLEKLFVGNYDASTHANAASESREHGMPK
ncbi:unnamed protein product, partial [Effrenium voratum]